MLMFWSAEDASSSDDLTSPLQVPFRARPAVLERTIAQEVQAWWIGFVILMITSGGYIIMHMQAWRASFLDILH